MLNRFLIVILLYVLYPSILKFFELFLSLQDSLFVLFADFKDFVLVFFLFAASGFLEDLNDLTDFDLDDFASFKRLILASFSAKHVANRVRDAIMIEL